MYEATQDAVWKHGIDLARESDFDLGVLRVRPASCVVERDGIAQILQRRVMQVLVALAGARGEVVSQDDLIIRCWRGLSVSDDAIYRCISKLRKLAADYPEPPFAIEAIPGVGYRLTPGAGAHARHAGVRRRFSILAAAVCAVLLVGALAWSATMTRAGQPTRVLVQQFEAAANSDANRSLSRQIANSLVNALGEGHVEAALGGHGAGRPPGLIVSGLLREEASNLVADVRVEDGATRAALWSATFKRDRRQAHNLALEVAARVADIVGMANFARTADPPLTDQSGLSALLQTTDMIRDANGGAWAQMVENAQTLVRRHPDFVFGHSVLAAAYAEAANSIAVPAQAQAMREAARREARLTLALDPQDAGAYAVLRGIEPLYDYAAREEILLRGIEVAKHPKEPLGALYSYQGTLLSSVGRLREALSYQLVARATDPWGPPKVAKLALNYANIGELPAARSWLHKAAQRWPDHSAVRAARFYTAAFIEQPADGLAAIDAIDGPDTGKAIWREFILARSARPGPGMRATLRNIGEAANDKAITRETEIMMLAGLGETARAVAAANRALDEQKIDPRMLFTPVMADVRRDPAFVPLAARMGLIKYWRDTGKRPDFCTGPAARRDCPAGLRAALGS